jgi:hypothetical protein
LQRISCEHQTYYEKTYSPNPGDSSLRHGSIVLRDPGHHDYDDDQGDVGDGRAHAGGPTPDINATDKTERLLGGETRFRRPSTRCGQSLARQGAPLLREFRSLSIRGRYFHRIGFVSIKPTYENYL